MKTRPHTCGQRAPGNRGAATELLTAADLLERGFYVFRSVTPHAPFDLVAYDRTAGRFLPVEVKSDITNASKAARDIHGLVVAVRRGMTGLEYVRYADGTRRTVDPQTTPPAAMKHARKTTGRKARKQT